MTAVSALTELRYSTRTIYRYFQFCGLPWASH